MVLKLHVRLLVLLFLKTKFSPGLNFVRNFHGGTISVNLLNFDHTASKLVSLYLIENFSADHHHEVKEKTRTAYQGSTACQAETTSYQSTLSTRQEQLRPSFLGELSQIDPCPSIESEYMSIWGFSSFNYSDHVTIIRTWVL